MKLSVASLFTGLGGFDLAAEQLGHKVVLQAEIDSSARKLLRQRFPNVLLADDATRVDLRGIDIVLAGFPCQGVSAAASTRKHGGLFDPESKSFVVWQVLDRIAEAKVPFLLLENSDSLKTKRYKDDLQALVSIIQAHGYDCHVVRLNSGCYGSAMRRVRTFLLCRRRAFLLPDVSGELVWRCDADGIGVNNMQGGAVFCAQPSVTLKAKSYSIMVTREEVRKLLPEAVEVLFGLPVGWTEPAGSETARYERLGNAVSVDAARAAIGLLVSGDAPMMTPAYRYADLLPLTEVAGGGTAGSAIGRVLRDVSDGRGAVNEYEWRYCLPVYLKHMDAHADEVKPQMWDYVKDLKKLVPKWKPKPWPKSATVAMDQ